VSGTRRPPLPEGPYLVVGLARSGRAAALALRARGQEVIGVDAGEPPGVEALREAGVEVRTGERSAALAERARTLVKSPGVPAGEPLLLRARERGVPVLGELELAWRMLESEVIAVTGTNGKTTTTELIGHVHRTAGVRVAVAGNVGVPLSALAYRDEGALEPAALPPGTAIVCEASSFQLEDADAFAPEAAVLLNITPDHLDRHGTVEAYREAKLKIFARQLPSDLAVIPVGIGVDPRAGGGRAHEVRFGEDDRAQLRLAQGALWWERLGEPLLAVSELHLRGRHNVENAMAAAAVCLARGLEPAAVRAALRDFPGVRHRLEEVGVRAGVLYVNDSKATNVASTLVALRALSPIRADEPAAGASAERAIHLILGGQSKGQELSELRAEVARNARAVYLIGEDAPLLEHALAEIGPPVIMCGDLERAVERARASARPGDVVLLSPGCASFDQFADFEARGERFRELVGPAVR
jgi:UDP-N-acetylmuramoylalanine--D-glutamate ligase